MYIIISFIIAQKWSFPSMYEQNWYTFLNITKDSYSVSDMQLESSSYFEGRVLTVL